MDTCQAILKTGNRSGQLCGKLCKGIYENKHFCGVHKSHINVASSSTNVISQEPNDLPPPLEDFVRTPNQENVRTSQQVFMRRNQQRIRRHINYQMRNTTEELLAFLLAQAEEDDFQAAIIASENVQHNNPISSTNLQNKTTLIKCEKEDNSCAICQDKFIKDQDLRKLECNHTYHKECVDKWFERQNTCPECRHKH